jgi:CheY-like chemotaxis protein
MRLRQVMLNVVSNSIKYNRAGGRVEISLAQRGTNAEIEVADTGIGMTQEQLGHLYEPFNRLGRERGDVEGTGLGLALSRQLAELMRGSIDIQSRPGEGTRVLVTLELATEHAAGAAPALEASDALATQRDPRGVVLYIEDSKVNLLLVQEMLKQWPEVTLLQAETGRDGLMLARSAAPDLVLLDMRLPDMTGEQVLAALRAEPATASLKVYALSASAMPDEVAAAREAGANDYWTKPLDVDRFLRELSRVLSDARAG